MTNRNAHILEEMTWPEVRDALADLKVVLLPTGSTEQHGPNTSFSTDTGRADGFAKLVAARMYPKALSVPPVGYGISYHHMRFPGSATLKPETFMAVVYEVVESYSKHGMRATVAMCRRCNW